MHTRIQIENSDDLAVFNNHTGTLKILDEGDNVWSHSSVGHFNITT